VCVGLLHSLPLLTLELAAVYPPKTHVVLGAHVCPFLAPLFYGMHTVFQSESCDLCDKSLWTPTRPMLCHNFLFGKGHTRAPSVLHTYTVPVYLATYQKKKKKKKVVRTCTYHVAYPLHSLSQLAAVYPSSQNTRGSQCTCVPFSNQKVVTLHNMIRTYHFWYHGTNGTYVPTTF
jgi:hypothetical protein